MRFGRFWLVAIILGGIMTFAGINEILLAFQNSKQVEMPLAQYLREKPEGRWVKLTGCRVAYPGLVYVQKVGRTGSRPEQVTVPVYAGSDFGQPVKVILNVSSSRAKEVVRNPDALGMRTETVEGVIRSSANMNEKLKKLAPWKPADKYIIIDEGRKPNMKHAFMMLGIGVALLGWMAMSTMKRLMPAVPQPSFDPAQPQLS